MVLNKSIRVLKRWRPKRSVLLESKAIPEEAILFESGSLALLRSSEADLIRKEYPDVNAAYALLGVLQVGQSLSYIVLVTGCNRVGKISGVEIYQVTHTLMIPLHSAPTQHEGVVAMGKLLACGQFYFSVPADERPGGGAVGGAFSLLSRCQSKGANQSHFCWNRSLYVYLQRFAVNTDRWVTPLLCGSVQIQTVYAGDKQVKACLVSRVSCERAGTRFNVRGLNDEGNVANFVESEQILSIDGAIASFVQVRGLVPVFWDQPGIQTGTNRVRLSRGFHCSHSAFVRHFESLLSQYGPCLCVDLLGKRDMEPLLSEAYVEHLRHLELPGAAEYVQFDYHLHCKPRHTEALGTILLPQCSRFLENCSYYNEVDDNVITAQTGVLRMNCLDCLDRSNNCQAMFGQQMLVQQLEGLKISSKATLLSRFKQIFDQMWMQNGDNISKLYAGTRALGSSSKVSKLRNSARSVQRTIVNNFMDSSKQEAIDLLLLNGYAGEIGMLTRSLLKPADLLASLPLRKALTDRWEDYTTQEKLRVCIGTWNVNGGKQMRSIALKNHSMHDWLLDAPVLSGKTSLPPADVYAIGFQELVGLTASNLVSTNSSNRYAWGAELQHVLSRDHEYSLLTAEQLVGVCLYIFVRPHLVPFIRDVGVSAVKTGIGGAAGNKGGVAIRFLLHSTSLCFVCSHLAAHQTKVVERNQDFAEIYRKVQFPMNQTIGSHDYIFWCGDLNYRIELPTSIAKDAISKEDWEKLVRHDQLIKQKKLGKVFQGFAEGDLTFAPTYKYDQFSDDYDTSEKCRTPAWCDRILWQRKSFLPPLTDQRAIARLRDEESTNDTDESGCHPSSVGRVYKRELTSDHPSLSWWSAGSLLHYGRAELKTSDHRPVVAYFEIDVFRVNEKERERVRGIVLEEMGPADATIRVKPKAAEYNSIDTKQLIKALLQYGTIVLVRVSDEETCITFETARSAINAISFNGQEVNGIEVEVKLSETSVIDCTGNSLQLLTAAELGHVDTEEGEEGEQDLIFSGDENDQKKPLYDEYEAGGLEPSDSMEKGLEQDEREYDKEYYEDEIQEDGEALVIKTLEPGGLEGSDQYENHSDSSDDHLPTKEDDSTIPQDSALPTLDTDHTPNHTNTNKPTRPPRPPPMKSSTSSPVIPRRNTVRGGGEGGGVSTHLVPPTTKLRSASELSSTTSRKTVLPPHRPPPPSRPAADRPSIPDRPLVPDRPVVPNRPPPPSVPTRPLVPNRPPPPYKSLYPEEHPNDDL